MHMPRRFTAVRFAAIRRNFALAAFAAFLTSACAITAFAQFAPTNPLVYPPKTTPFGLSYSQWSARQWQWAYSLPIDHHPLFDNADVSTGNSGYVWFLGGSFTATPPDPSKPEVILAQVERTCEVPAGTALFFPILNSEASIIEGNGPSESDMRATAVWLMDHAQDLACEVDGVPIANLEQYRVQSPLFTFGPLPENSVLAWEGYPVSAGDTSLAVSDGYFLMLKPLPVGRHDLHFHGAAVFTEAADGFNLSFTLDITYHLTVDLVGTNVVTRDVAARRGVARDLLAHLWVTTKPKSQLIGMPLKFYVDGELVGSTFSDDPAKVSFTPPMAMSVGKHELKVVFEGDELYHPSFTTATLTIVK